MFSRYREELGRAVSLHELEDILQSTIAHSCATCPVAEWPKVVEGLEKALTIVKGLQK